MKYFSFSNKTSDKITTPSLELSTSTPGIDRDVLHRVFCRKFISELLLLEVFFDMRDIETTP